MVNAIAVEDRQYKTYVLTDEAANSAVEIVPERGGILLSWKLHGHELFYLDAERFKDPALTVRGGNPILFPICGNLPDNIYTLNGQSYTLKQHGFARELPWSVVEHSTEPLSLTVGLTSSDYTRAGYPFDFDLAFSYILAGDTLTQRQKVTNKSAEPMPFSVGFHPYFAVQDKSKLQFQIPAADYYDQRSKSRLAYSGSFDFAQDEIDAAFTELSSHVATTTDGDRLRLTFSTSPEFSTLVFWTVKGKDFYCLEPWTAARNAMNTGDHLLTVAPGATLETEFTLKAELL
jgi:galactose mutarotase-like enzyme